MKRLTTNEDRLASRKHYIDLYKATAVEITEADCTIAKYEYGEKFGLMIFDGKAGKPGTHYYYSTDDRRQKEIDRHIESRKNLLAWKAEEREKNKGTLTGSAATAKAIRERLKKEFPEIKFSVKSDNYSGGNSVDVYWTDGPVTSIIQPILSEYQYGHFDGMTDCYEHHNINQNLGCPGAKYVHGSRTQSEERKQYIKSIYDEKYGADSECYKHCGEFNAWHFENDHPEAWDKKYQDIKIERERIASEKYLAECEKQLALIEEKETPSKCIVIDFAKYKTAAV